MAEDPHPEGEIPEQTSLMREEQKKSYRLLRSQRGFSRKKKAACAMFGWKGGGQKKISGWRGPSGQFLLRKKRLGEGGKHQRPAA